MTLKAVYTLLARIANLGLAGWMSQQQILWTSVESAEENVGREVLILIQAVFGDFEGPAFSATCSETLVLRILVRYSLINDRFGCI